MIVQDDDRGSVEADGLAEEFAWTHDGGVQRADVGGVDFQDVILRVQDDDLEVFLLQGHHFHHQEVGSVGG